MAHLDATRFVPLDIDQSPTRLFQGCPGYTWRTELPEPQCEQTPKAGTAVG